MQIVNEFHQLYYNSGLSTWENTYWVGVRTQKCPLTHGFIKKLFLILNLISLLEVGTCWKGSALYLATICDLIKKGKVQP